MVLTEYMTEKEFASFFEQGEMCDVVRWVEIPEWGEKIDV